MALSSRVSKKQNFLSCKLPLVLAQCLLLVGASHTDGFQDGSTAMAGSDFIPASGGEGGDGNLFFRAIEVGVQSFYCLFSMVSPPDISLSLRAGKPQSKTFEDKA